MEFFTFSATVPTLVTVALPSGAKTSKTALRWRQLTNSGANLDTWTLNNVRVNGTNSQFVSVPNSDVTLSGNANIFTANFDTNRVIG